MLGQLYRETDDLSRITVDLYHETDDLYRETDSLSRITGGPYRETGELYRKTDDLYRETDDLSRKTDGLSRVTDDLYRVPKPRDHEMEGGSPRKRCKMIQFWAHCRSEAGKIWLLTGPALLGMCDSDTKGFGRSLLFKKSVTRHLLEARDANCECYESIKCC
jgi:hypothetical protein